MKLVFVTDIHCRMTTPTARLDDYYKSCLEKLTWIINYCNQDDDVVALVMGGDIGDSWHWSPVQLNDLSALFSTCTKPIITVVGNHDVVSRRTKSYKNSSLQSLANSKGVPLTIIPPESVDPIIIGDFEIYGFACDTKMCRDFVDNKFKLESDSDLTKVAVCHESVGPKKSFYCKGFTEVHCKGFDMALFGDIHTGWKPTKLKSGCISANPGSLMRSSISDSKRKPKILEVYTDRIEEVVVPHKTKDEVFSKAIEKMQESAEESSKAFLAALAKKESSEVTDPKEIIKKVGKAAKYSKESINLLISELK